MTYDDYRDSLASSIRGVTAEIGGLVQSLGYGEEYSDLSLRHAQDGSAKIRAALDRLDRLNVRYGALCELNTQEKG